MEVNIYPKGGPELAELISGCLGECSPSYNTFGYYTDGVALSTSPLPTSWEDRLM